MGCRILLWFFFSCCALFPVAGFSSGGDSPPEDVEKADRLFRQKRYDLALRYYESLSLKDPYNKHFLYAKAFCELQTRRFLDAERSYGALLTLEPNDDRIIQEMGYTLKMLGKYREAASCFAKLEAFNLPLARYQAAACAFPSDSTPPATKYRLEPAPFNSAGSEIFMTVLNDRLIGGTTSMHGLGGHGSRTVGPSAQAAVDNFLFSRGLIDTARVLHAPDRHYGSRVGPISFAQRTGMIAYCTNHFTEGVRQIAQAEKNMQIYFADLNERDEWIDHRPFPYNDTAYSIGYPFLTNDGTTLYFASNMSGGYGGFDIYVSYFIDSLWTEPQNLGPRVNTPGNEVSPFFDGMYLYFSSDWHPGYGGLDVFRADFDYESWMDPVNLGPAVNSSYDDLNFVFFDKLGKGFLISDRPGGKGHEDIYFVYKKSKQVQIQVRDFKSLQPLTGAVVDLTRCGDPAGITDESGTFNFEIIEGFDCYLSINKVGYTSTSFRLRYQDIEGQEKRFKLMLTPTVNFYYGQVVELQSQEPINSVYISAVNELDGEVQETYTDARGSFALHIKPRGRYHISFAKTGYTPHYINAQMDTKVDPQVISQVVMSRADNIMLRDYYKQDVLVADKPAQAKAAPPPADLSASLDDAPLNRKTVAADKPAVVSPSAGTGVSGAGKEAEKEKERKTAAKEKDAVPPPPAIRIADFEAKVKPEEKIIGYVIQVAAIAKKKIDITPFKYSLNKYGELFVTRRDDQLLRVMVGVFNKREEAEDVLFKIREERFKEAFITPLPAGVKLESIEEYAVKEERAAKALPAPMPASLSSGMEEYMVRIGSFKNLSWFDNREVEAIGLIEERKQNGYTIVLLSGYTSLDEAREALSKVQELGYKDAFVVKNQSGELLRVQ